MSEDAASCRGAEGRVPSVSEVGARIRRARQRAGMTQKHLAEAVGYSAANPISKLESGHVASIDVVLLTRIAEATKVPLAWLLGRGPETEPSEVWRVLLEHSQRQLRLLQRIADRLDRCPPRKKEA